MSYNGERVLGSEGVSIGLKSLVTEFNGMGSRQ